MRRPERETFKVISRLPVVGAFSQHGSPESGRLIVIAAFLGQRRQIAPGEVAVDALVHAGKLLRPLDRQNPPPAPLGPVVIASLAANNRLAKEQLGVVRVDRQARRARRQSLLGLAQHLVRPRDQGIQLAGDRIGRRRSGQAVAQMLERLPPVLSLDGDRAEVEENKRIIRPLGEFLA